MRRYYNNVITYKQLIKIEIAKKYSDYNRFVRIYKQWIWFNENCKKKFNYLVHIAEFKLSFNEINKLPKDSATYQKLYYFIIYV